MEIGFVERKHSNIGKPICNIVKPRTIVFQWRVVAKPIILDCSNKGGGRTPLLAAVSFDGDLVADPLRIHPSF